MGRTVDRAVVLIVAVIVVAVPVGTLVGGVYPLSARRLWVDVTNGALALVTWAINPVTVAIGIALFYVCIATCIVVGLLRVRHHVRSYLIRRKLPPKKVR